MCIKYKYKVGCVRDPIYMPGTRYNFRWGRNRSMRIKCSSVFT